MKNFSIKRFTASLLFIVMVVAALPVSLFNFTISAEETVSTIIAMSDYQNSSADKKTVPQTIVNAMVNAGVVPELALIAGDYTDGSVGADGDDQSRANLKTELGNLTGILTSAWSGLPYYAIQGNHDYSGFLTDDTLKATGAYPQDNYIIYLINEDDFPWWQGNYGSGSTSAQDKATVTATANALKTYLDSLDGSKPVIIQTHVPMHWSERSTSANWYYDNIYANILFDVVNEAAKKLDILFMFGHNHSSTASGGDYDHEIGGALAYVAKGESMKVPNGTDGTSNYTTETLNFTYMNSGYVGKYAGSTANTSISAITIDSDSIDIERYTYSGSVVKKTIALTGGSGDTSTDDDNASNGDTSTETIGAWVTIPGSSASAGGYEQVTDLTTLSANEKYIVVLWRYFGNFSDGTGDTYNASNGVIFNGTTSAGGKAVIAGASGNEYSAITTTDTDESNFWYLSYNNGKLTLKNVGSGRYLSDSSVGTTSTVTSFTVLSGKCNGYDNFVIENSSGYHLRTNTNANDISWRDNTDAEALTAANACNITIYKMATASEGTPDTYARLTGETVQSYDSGEGKTVNAVLSKLSIETSTDGSTVAETVAVTSSMVTWNKTFNGSNIGTYVGTITYEGQTLGTVTVNISGTAEEVTGSGDWVQTAEPTGGTTTYIYTQATSITAGEEYVIVGNDHAIALQGTTSMGTQSVTISGSTMTSTTALTEWTFSGSNSGTIYNGTRYLRYSTSGWSGSFNLSKSSSTLTFTDNGSNFRIYNNASYVTDYSFYYNGSSWTRSDSTQYVRLYQLTDITTTGGGDAEYARLTGTIEQVYSNTDATTVSTVLGKVNIEISTDKSTVKETVAVTSDMVTWDTTFNGSVAGVYTGTVTYEGKALGTIKVTVTPVSVEKIELITDEGTVTRGSKTSATTGGKLRVTYTDGSTKDVDITLGMLNNDGKTEGTFSGLTVTYGGKTVEGFTLTVTPHEGNNYPEYPNEGAIKVDKTAIYTEEKFRETGVAQVELSVSGIPMNQGVDVVVVLDTSSSMQETVEGFSSNRLTILRPAVNSLIEQLQTKREDGSDPNIDIAFVAFNGFTGNGNSSTKYGSNNYIGDQAYATPNKGGWLTDKSGDGWVDIMDLGTNWADENQGNISTGSGTNYDEGLLMAYELLASKQEAWANGEIREQYVVFMSDGAPFQYNGVYSNYTQSEWNNWLLGNYATSSDIPNTVTNKEYYAGYAAGQGQDHRIAEAIKGDPNSNYDIVTTTSDTNGTTQLVSVPGLGATLYAIGYLLADNGQVTDEIQNTVLKNIASSSEVYFDVDTAEQLDAAFSQISSAVLMAATSARFVDQMGSAFKLQTASTVTRKVDDKEITLTDIGPKIEVKTYEIWTRQEMLSGACSEDKVGTRKSTTATPIETITFNDAGTKAYSTLNSVGPNGETIIAGNNILIDGVIYASTFFYNNNEGKSVTIETTADGTYSLAPETFYWKVGTVNTTELAISYYVYLTDTQEGEREAGSYPTNNFAILYYDNYLGNACKKETVSPMLAWKEANVSYAFYLVDTNGNVIVNRETGATGTFANRIAITKPVVFATCKLNTANEVPALSVSETDLPGEYTIFDQSAVYKVVVLSYQDKDDATVDAGWTITSGKNVATTYVTGYSHTESYSNALNQNGNYDYTHTTVWFAVVWDPGTIADQVVIDYGLPVDINVLENDLFASGASLNAIGTTANKPTMADGHNYTSEKSEKFASVLAYKGDEGVDSDNALSFGRATVNGNKVRYTPTSTKMDTYDKFAYEVKFDYKGTEQYYYGDVTVIPATIIYYEESFVTFAPATNAENGIGVWTDDGEYDSDATQDEDRPGEYSLSTIDHNNVYGYDGINSSATTYSLGNAKTVKVSSTVGNLQSTAPTAKFTFSGTGFDIISMTNSASGAIIVSVYKSGTTDSVADKFVDNYYGYTTTTDETGKTVWTPDPSDEAIYQVPVMKIDGLDHGTYDVTIWVTYSKFFDHDDSGDYSFWLDSIRIYDPADDGINGKDTTIKDAYVADGESYPHYLKVKDAILDPSNIETDRSLPGAVFIDGKANTESVTDYTNPGPNNEAYLINAQSISFKLTANAVPMDVQLGAKLASGSSATVNVYYGSTTSDPVKIELDSATDMYYSIMDKLPHTMTDGSWTTNTIIIEVVADDSTIVSLTNIKATFSSDTVEYFTGGTVNETSATASNGVYSLMSARMVNLETVAEEEPVSISFLVDAEVIEDACAVMTALYAPEPEIFVPEALEYTVTNRFFGNSTVNVITSKDVASLTVNGVEAKKLSNSPLFSMLLRLIDGFESRFGANVSANDFIIWSASTKRASSYDIVAYNADGLSSDPTVTDSSSSITKEDIDNYFNRSELYSIMEQMASQRFDPEQFEAYVNERFDGFREIITETSEDVEYVIINGKIVDRYITETVIDTETGETTTKRVWITDAEDDVDDEDVEVNAYDEKGVGSESKWAERKFKFHFGWNNSNNNGNSNSASDNNEEINGNGNSGKYVGM